MSEIVLNSDHLKKIVIPSTGFADTYVPELYPADEPIFVDQEKIADLDLANNSFGHWASVSCFIPALNSLNLLTVISGQLYNIEVSLYDYSWSVKRRYREFCDLHEKLTKQFPKLLEKTTFPPKKLFGNYDPVHVEKRRLCLEAYLQNVVTQLGKIPRSLQIFLEFHVYDVLAVTQTLAEELFKIGDRILENKETFRVTPLQLYCITKRLKLPVPTCGSEGYRCDVGNLYDIVYCVQNLEIVEDNKHNLNNFSDQEISFDLSLFKNLKNLQISKCNIESLQGTFHLQKNLQRLSVHNSLHLLKDILIDQDVWTHDACEKVLEQGSSAIMAWKHLIDVDCSHNGVSYIDESVTLLHELVRLDLSHNNIKEIAHLEALSNLRELNLSFNEIENVDAVNSMLGNITTLRLAGNKLSSVGDLPKMFSLVNLDLSENSISDMSDVISLAQLPCLENLILLANPVRHKNMYRIQLLTAFEHRVSLICLDKLIPTDTEIKNVMRILSEEDRDEFVNVPHSTPTSPRKSKAGQRKTLGRKVKTQDVLEKTQAVSLPGNEISNTEDEQEYRDRVERIRKLGGDSWLGLLNEIHNENKDGSNHTSFSLPHHGHAPSAVQTNDPDVVASSSSFRGNINETKEVKGVQSKEHTELQFGFSAELENLVKLTMEQDTNVLIGPFFVSVEEESVEEERMVGVDLKKGILMEIVIDTGVTCRKYQLDEVTSVDILESSGSWSVDLVHTDDKQMRRHADFASGNAMGNFQHIAKYHMRSMKDAAELFVLLYKFLNDFLSERSPRRSNSVLSQSPQAATDDDVTSAIGNPVGLPPELLHQFLNSKFVCPLATDLTESAQHATETKGESAHLILWLSCLPYALPEHELPVCLVLTNLNIYLFHLVALASIPKKVEQFEKMLSLMCCAPLTELCKVVRGVFDLTFRLEFSKRGQHGTFTFLSRDSEMTESFVKLMDEVTMSSGVLPNIRSYEIVNTSEARLEKLKRDIAMSCGKTFKDGECVLIYAVVRELAEVTSSTDDTSSTSSHMTSATRSLVLTNLNLFLCEEDHLHWPSPSYVKNEPSTPQCVVTKHNDVKHIIGIDVYDVTGDCAFVGASGMSLILEHNAVACEEIDPSVAEQASRKTETWNIIFKLKKERNQFQRSLAQIWSYHYDGELQITQSKSICSNDIYHSPRVDVAQFFQEGLVSSAPDSSSRPAHSRNASGQFHPVLSEDSLRKSVQALHDANADLLERFFYDTLRQRRDDDPPETLVSYACTGCVAYTHPTREVHVWLVLSSSKVYIVADVQDGRIIGSAQNVQFGTGTKLCFIWLPIATLRQVCVGFFDQTFRLETDEPERTFTFITRDYDVTSCFLENLKSVIKKIDTELPVPTKSSDHSPSIYDAYPSTSEVDNDCSVDEIINHSKGVVVFVKVGDDAVEILKHSVFEYAKALEFFTSPNDIGIILYLLMFQVIEGKKLPRSFMILSNHTYENRATLCTCIENHVNFPLPLFVKGLPVGSRYEIQRLRLITDVKRIEFSGFATQDFTIVCKKERLQNQTEEIGKTAGVENRTCADEEERWTMIAQTYEEKEKALRIIRGFWKENVGEELPVLNT